jgi:hypothetical protein
MTDAHAKAVEAAAFVLQRTSGRASMSDCITAYLAAMRGEGWVMVRDVGEADSVPTPRSVAVDYENAWPDDVWDAGWDACRVAMLKGDGDGQG